MVREELGRTGFSSQAYEKWFKPSKNIEYRAHRHRHPPP